MRESSTISHLARRCLAAAMASAAIPAWPVSATTNDPASVTEHARGGGAHVSRDFSGVLPTGENQTLRLNTDLGSVRIVPMQSGASPTVRYSVHIETDARGAAASMLLDHYLLSARSTANGAEINGNLPQSSHGASFWVHFEVAVPANYSLDVYTGTGDIQTFDVGGSATLVTEGGNIIGGKLGTNLWGNGRSRLAAKLQTQGGHIQVDDVMGDVTAFTAGGHINTGHIYGEANLHSGGGHIRAAGIDGTATLVTEGGNITVGKAAKFVAVKTGGGQIDFGEVRGSVHAQTGGGGIRVMYVSGPMDVESSGGSICLTRVSGSVRAATDSGTITAWINPDNAEKQHDSVSLPGASQLTSADGDIVVFLPRNLAANIEAIVERGGPHRIEADPALALQFEKVSSRGPAKAFASLNGGGAVLRLKTTGGKIKLQYMESESALWNSMMQDQQARMERELSATPAVFASGSFPPLAAAPPAPATRYAPPVTMPAVVAPPTPAPQPAPAADPDSVLPGTWPNRLENRLLGGVREDGDEFWRHIKQHPNPVYPDIARKAGVEGTVRLQVRLKQDGKIEVEKILEGDTLLADAAIAAMKQWRGKPAWMDDKPVDVISTLTFRFKLRE